MMDSVLRKTSGSLTQQVVEHISSLIASGSLVPGEKLPPEFEIVRREGVSRTVVREAMSKLQAAGLVATRHGVGTFVCEPANRTDFGLEHRATGTAEDVLAVLELRIGLEAMRLAMEAFRDEIVSGQGAIDPDFRFHLEIARAAGNPYILDILTTLGPKVIPRSRFQIDEQEPQRQEYLKRINNEHEDIYNAIVRADPEASRAAVRNHLGNSRERMKQAAGAGETL